MNKNEDERVTGRGLLNMATEYIETFKILNKANDSITNKFHVKFYLLAHSIELSMKSYLRFNGYSLKQLKDLGHDLKNIYKELSQKFTYRLDPKALEMINIINVHYKNKEFEYPKVGIKNVVELKDLCVVAILIQEATSAQSEAKNIDRK